eukprot:5264904-Amphidinium_carterae.1
MPQEKAAPSTNKTEFSFFDIFKHPHRIACRRPTLLLNAHFVNLPTPAVASAMHVQTLGGTRSVLANLRNLSGRFVPHKREREKVDSFWWRCVMLCVIGLAPVGH